jgi:DNA repair protein RecN (Recombination protein N)
VLSGLIKRYGSIEETLNQLEIKKNELKSYQDIEFKKNELKSNIDKLYNKLLEKSKIMTKKRAVALKRYEKKANSYLKSLYLNKIELNLIPKEIGAKGADDIEVKLHEINIKKISTGELNRLRVALIATNSSFVTQSGGILFLDEIDANLSGKESMSVANVLEELSKDFQIFAISHHPQLTSKASRHFFVEKSDNKSRVYKLEDSSREKEIARMISGEEISQEALEYAKSLLKR